MIRALITPKEQNISLHLPDSYIGKNVEVIAFTLDEAVKEVKKEDIVMTHFASQSSLSKDWLTSEEDEAWKDL